MNTFPINAMSFVEKSSERGEIVSFSEGFSEEPFFPRGCGPVEKALCHRSRIVEEGVQCDHGEEALGIVDHPRFPQDVVVGLYAVLIESQGKDLDVYGEVFSYKRIQKLCVRKTERINVDLPSFFQYLGIFSVLDGKTRVF